MATARFQIFSVARRAPTRLLGSNTESDTAAIQGFTWRFLSANNRSLARAVLIFPDVKSCLTSLHDLRRRLGLAVCVTSQDGPATWVWRVRLAGFTVAVSSRRYQRRVRARHACESFFQLVEQASPSDPVQVMEF